MRPAGGVAGIQASVSGPCLNPGCGVESVEGVETFFGGIYEVWERTASVTLGGVRGRSWH